mgnify:CR=1 FL=1
MSHSILEQELNTSRSMMTVGETQTNALEMGEAGIQTKEIELKDCVIQTTPIA